MMKFLYAVIFVLSSVGYTNGYDFTCIAGIKNDADADGTNTNTVDCTSNDTATDAGDAQSEAQCHSPDNTVAGNEYTEYACGACAAEVTGTCVSCNASSDSNCNTYEAPTINFNCVKNGADVACTGKTIACFGPTAAYTGNDTVLTEGGCGTCAVASFNSTDCKDCATEKCNSAGKLVAVIAPLLAVFFWLH